MILTEQGQAAPPYTAEEIESFNAYQAAGVWHPFTCGNEDSSDLVAQEDCLACPNCDYRQYWGHVWMFDWRWRKMSGLNQ